MTHLKTADCNVQVRCRMQDLLDNLLVARDEAGSGMADAALRDELMTLLVAGQV